MDRQSSSAPAPETPKSVPDDGPKGDVNKLKMIWEHIEDVNIKEEEFDDLFSRAVSKPKPKQNPKVSPSKADKPASILDSKRAQNIGIFLRSTHIDVGRLEDLVYNLEITLDQDELTQVQELQGDQQTVEDVVRGEELYVAGSIVQSGVENMAGVNTTSGENICRISKNIWITMYIVVVDTL